MTLPKQLHTFHIPVMGLAYTIDSPVRVAQYGIDSVISIVDDELIEKMNAFYSKKFELPYKEITQKIHDYRAERITAYLDKVDTIVKQKFDSFCNDLAESRQAMLDYIAMLPQKSEIKQGLQEFLTDGINRVNELKVYIANNLYPGSIDVNIMTKVDKTNFSRKEALPVMYNDAHAALRGFAKSKLNSSLILSAGMNPSLYNYIASFDDFFPDGEGNLKKKIVLKVSDFRSAMIQGSYLAKKGIWVSEYRIESGLNCGGHAFATDGLLLGHIMNEFKQRKVELTDTAHNLFVKALSDAGRTIPLQKLKLKITVQGGVGTAEEHDFLLNEYAVNSIGWGTPFLMVSEATSVDGATRELLATATEKDFYRSDISPLGVPFNTVKDTTNDFFKSRRIHEGKAGSSCPKKLLALSREYDEQGICTASRKYQQLKLNELLPEKDNLPLEEFHKKHEAITVKSCLCVGLANAAYLENEIAVKGEKQGIVICPGPNMAYFDKEVSLKDMVGHIYGGKSVLAEGYRPNMFIKELQLYVDYLAKELTEITPSKPQIKKWIAFKNNLLLGICYYEELFTETHFFTNTKTDILEKLDYYKNSVEGFVIPEAIMVTA